VKKSTKPKEPRPKRRSETTTESARPSPVEIARMGGIRKTPDVTHRKSPHFTEGEETGLSVFQYLAALFQANEQLPAKEKMTDAEIERKIVAEFPNEPIARQLSARPREYTVNWFRQRYIEGRFTQGQVPTDGSALPISHRYGINGTRVKPRTGKPLT